MPVVHPSDPPTPPPADRLRGRVALVTGAARGIGRAVAQRYLEEGATVVAVDRIADELQAQVDAWRAEGLPAHTAPADVTSEEDVARVVDAAMAARGRLDVLANVAGVIVEAGIEATDPATFDRILAVNLRGPYLLCRAVAPHMKRAGRGAMINVSSRSGVEGSANLPAYAASKFGLEGLSRSLAIELAPHGVAVFTITPGTPTHTAMSETTYTPDARAIWRDPYLITPAFVDLALRPAGSPGDGRVDAWALSLALARHHGARPGGTDARPRP
jgi:NAD(P)-dependent dehydrogenase (short-subunit alcohol dehydrogenase family)